MKLLNLTPDEIKQLSPLAEGRELKWHVRVLAVNLREVAPRGGA